MEQERQSCATDLRDFSFHKIHSGSCSSFFVVGVFCLLGCFSLFVFNVEPKAIFYVCTLVQTLGPMVSTKFLCLVHKEHISEVLLNSTNLACTQKKKKNKNPHSLSVGVKWKFIAWSFQTLQTCCNGSTMNWNVDKGNKKTPKIHLEQTHFA